MSEKVELSKELQDFILEWKNKPGNLIVVLHRVQEIYGFIPRDVAHEVSRKLEVPLAKIFGVATFYHFFKLTKPGTYQIAVCMGTACYLKGGEDLLEELKNLLGVEEGQTTSDGKFSIEGVRCVGCCGLAPAIVINGKVFGKVVKDDLPEILAQYTKEEVSS